MARRLLGCPLNLASTHGGSVTLLRVHAEAASLDPDEVKVDLAVIEGETEAMTRRAVERARTLGLAVYVSATVRAGPLEATLLATAEELRTQLIVMGSHGRHGMTDRLLGFTAERVVARATCAVLVMKAEGFPVLRD